MKIQVRNISIIDISLTHKHILLDNSVKLIELKDKYPRYIINTQTYTVG